MNEKYPPSFEDAATGKPPSLGREIIEMLKHNKKWWMIPIIIILLIFGLLLILSTTGAAPFIYTLF